MQIALSQLNFHIGNFEENERKIIRSIIQAKQEGAELIVFSELAISGYPARDFLEFDDFLAQCEQSIDRIAKACKGIAAIVGSPSKNTALKGKKLHNTAFFLRDGEVHAVYHKELLPTYDVFDENRYFEAGSEGKCIEYKGKTIALTICEDLWNIPGNHLYKSSPMERLIKEEPDFIINIAASPFSHRQLENRDQILRWNSKEYQLPIFYVNHVGAQTELIFDGGSSVVDETGALCQRMSFFEEDFAIFDTGKLNKKKSTSPSKYERIEKALVLGIRDYFRKLNFETATLGLSGGIDSALTLALAVKALGKEKVIPIMMPSQFSSDHSVNDSIQLCKNLGCASQQIEIETIFHAFEQQLSPLFKGTAFGIAEENIQSRVRGTLLMAHTNKFGTILLNTSNKSELAVGYGTLYGDMSGGLSVLGDLYKTEVFELAAYLNREEELIPNNILIKEPSAELRPDQKDSDSLPDYEILDAILMKYIEEKMSPNAIIKLGYDEALVRRIMKMVNMNEYKRFQAPPILRISEKAFGMGRRMPLVGKYLS